MQSLLAGVGKSSHQVKISSTNNEKVCVLNENEIYQVFVKKCKDNKFEVRQEQLAKFKEQVSLKSINRKLVLTNMGLSLEFAKYFSNMLHNFQYHNIDRISSIDLSMNNLRDPGIIELAKPIRYCKFIVKLDVSSNSISSKGFQTLCLALEKNEGVCMINFSTKNGVNRNRLQEAGGKHVAKLIGTPDCPIQFLNLNGCVLKDEGANHVFSMMSSKIERKLTNTL